MKTVFRSALNIFIIFSFCLFSVATILLCMFIASFVTSSAWSAGILASFLVYPVLPLFLRHLVFFFPYKFGEKRNKLFIVALTLVIAVLVFLLNSLVIGIQEEMLFTCPSAFDLPLFQQSNEALALPLMLICCQFFVLAYRYSNKQRVVDSIDFLYLRSFNLENDSANIKLLMQAAKGKGTVGFVLSPDSMLSSWSPFFLGFKHSYMFPFRGLPVVFKESNSHWKNDLEFLIKNSKCVVVDVTNATKNTLWELDSIKRLDCMKKTLILANQANYPDRLLGDSENIVTYNETSTWTGFFHSENTLNDLKNVIDDILRIHRKSGYLEARHRRDLSAIYSKVLVSFAVLMLCFQVNAVYFWGTLSQALYFENQAQIIRLSERGLADQVTSCGPFIVKSAMRKQYDQVELMLLHGANPNQTFRAFSSVYTPLRWAVEANDVIFAELLLRYGADPNHNSSDISSLEDLHLNSAFENNAEMMRLLEEYGAEPLSEEMKSFVREAI